MLIETNFFRRRTGKIHDSTTSSRMYRRGRKSGLPEPSSVSMLGRPGQDQVSPY